MPEATYTHIYCASAKDCSLNLPGNVEVADVIAPHVTQLSTLLPEPSCRLIKSIEIDYNFIEVEDHYLFDIAWKHFIKESGSLKRSLPAFIRYEYNESKKPNPAPLRRYTFRRYTSSLCNIFRLKSVNLKLNQGRKVLSHFITSCGSLAQLLPFYPLGWKENHFHLTTLKLVPSLQIFYQISSRLVTPYHTLSHLVSYNNQQNI